MTEKIIIVGSGPAGWTAAIYAARANLQPLVIEGSISEDNRLKGTLPLGQLNLTTEVENFPGFPKGVLGPDIMMAMKEQAERFGTRVISEDVTSIQLNHAPFTIEDSSGARHQAHTVVIATGASANYLNLPSEGRFKNNGVSACAVCDGALPRFRNHPIAVIGGGDSAAEEANYLSRFASKVYLIHRRNELRASRVMAERTLTNTKIQPVWDSVVEEIVGTDTDGVTGLRVKNIKTGHTSLLEATGMFVAIGHTPNTRFLNGQLQLDPKGFIVLKDPFRTFTSIDGVFAAGDVADPVYKQAITAAGMGCKAALDAEKYLVEKGIH